MKERVAEMYAYFIIAVVLLLAGHLCKICRWKQLITKYENVDMLILVRAMVLGQGINLIAPWRVGDIARVYFSGKYLKNGYALSLSTVVADLYMDTLTVGMAFSSLYILGIHKEDILGITKWYIFLSAAVTIVTVLFFAFKRHIKKIIRLFASVFNNYIELGILYITYATFASLKNIYKKVNLGKIIGFTVLMWGSYFSSYEMFARFMQHRGYDLTLTGVFKILFSFSDSLWGSGCLWYFCYLGFPLCLLGIYAFIRKPHSGNVQYFHLLPQLNQNEKLAFLEIYFGDESRKDYINLYLDINKDVSVIQDYSAGSNATTMLCISENTTFFRKYAFAEDAAKLKEQVQWLEKYNTVLPVASIIKKEYGENYCYYDMEYNMGAVGFFQYIHTMPMEKVWDILQTILDSLRCNLYDNVFSSAKRVAIKEYIDSKVVNNMEFCLNRGGKWLKGLSEYKVICINGIDYPNLSHYKQLLNYEKLCDRLMSERYSAIHGDLTIENIVCVQNGNDSWYLIDPNTGNIHESAFLDYAKLLQSLHGGYEFIMMVKDVRIEDNTVNFLYTKSQAYSTLYTKYKDYLYQHFSKEDVINIYIHEVIHWLRLMPYKVKKDPRKAVVFYAGMLMVLYDVEQMILEK
ncbi:MAG: flippase-like domain-containing protein [Blautia sp.]|nr:flippase-like domain-containing protein [Blautia sp.]